MWVCLVSSVKHEFAAAEEYICCQGREASGPYELQGFNLFRLVHRSKLSPMKEMSMPACVRDWHTKPMQVRGWTSTNHVFDTVAIWDWLVQSLQCTRISHSFAHASAPLD